MARGEIPPLLPPGDRHLHPPQAEGGHPTQDPARAEQGGTSTPSQTHSQPQGGTTTQHGATQPPTIQEDPAPLSPAHQSEGGFSFYSQSARTQFFSPGQGGPAGAKSKSGQPRRPDRHNPPAPAPKAGGRAKTRHHQRRAQLPHASTSPICRLVPFLVGDVQTEESTPGPGGVDDPTLGWRGGTGGGERPGAPEHDPPRLLRLRPREPNQHNDEPEPQGSRST